MTHITVAIAPTVQARLAELLALEVESAGVLLCYPAHRAGGSFRLLASQLVEAPEASYVARTCEELKLTSDAFVPALSTAARAGAIPLWFHTHVGDTAVAAFSALDDVVHEQLSELFALRSASGIYGSIVVAGAGVRAFRGYVASESHADDIDRLVLLGDGLRVLRSAAESSEPSHDMFDRNVRAFGGDVQAIIRDLRIGVVGAGGTGSAVAEQLTRLGARHLRVFDPKTLTESNLTRVYGSTPSAVGEYKSVVLVNHLRAIAPDGQYDSQNHAITDESTARHLADLDFVFGCTDDDAGRIVLSRLPSHLLIPVIDCGVVLSSDGMGSLSGIFGRVTTMEPNRACLVCRPGRIDFDRARAEVLDEDERAALAVEGYAPALGDVEPAVVTFTSAVAATAVSELLELLIGFGARPRPNEVILRMHDRAVSTNTAEPMPGHFCEDSEGASARVGALPFLGRVW